MRKVKEFERKGKIQRLIDRIMYASPGYALCPENRHDGILTINPAAKQVTPQRFRFLKDGRASYISDSGAYPPKDKDYLCNFTCWGLAEEP